MPIFVTINGVPKNLKRNTLEISKTANGRSTALFRITSTDGSYRPTMDQQLAILSGPGATITEFAGYIDRVTETGIVAGATPGIELEVNCSDFQGWADRRFVNVTLPAGTMKSQLLVLAAYLDASSGYSVTVDAGQVNGPAVTEQTYTYRQLSEALSDLAARTADAGEPYIWRISPSKVLKMYQASTTPAPFTLVIPSSDPTIGDIEVSQERQDYANRVIVTVPEQKDVGHVETFQGDGSTVTFQLNWTLRQHYGLIHVYELDGITPAGGETFGIPPDAPLQWSYSPLYNQITRLIGPTDATKIYSLTFDGTFAPVGIAEDLGEIGTYGITEKVIAIDNISSDITAADIDAIAANYLATLLSITETVHYPTDTAGLDVGMSQTVTVAKRNISTTAIISELHITDQGAKDESLHYDVTAVLDTSQTNLKKGWRDSIRQAWSLGSGGGGGTITAAAAPTPVPSAGGPGLPDTAVQFNRAGTFGGDAEFTYNEVTNSLCGGTLSSITAADHDACFGWGYDGHIADP